jgi:hypothetical protein
MNGQNRLIPTDLEKSNLAACPLSTDCFFFLLGITLCDFHVLCTRVAAELRATIAVLLVLDAIGM